MTDGIFSTRTRDTLILVRNTFNVRIANILLRAGAFLLMTNALTLGSNTTGVRKETEVDTGSLDTTLGVLAV